MAWLSLSSKKRFGVTTTSNEHYHGCIGCNYCLVVPNTNGRLECRHSEIVRVLGKGLQVNSNNTCNRYK